MNETDEQPRYELRRGKDRRFHIYDRRCQSRLTISGAVNQLNLYSSVIGLYLDRAAESLLSNHEHDMPEKPDPCGGKR